MEIPPSITRRIKQHVYGKSRLFFAIVQPGFEKTALNEMSSFGFDPGKIKIIEGGFEFVCNIRDVWKIHIMSRTITRIIMRVGKFKSAFFNDFQKNIAAIPWELHLLPDEMPGIKVKSSKSKLYHTERLSAECLSGIRTRMKKNYPEQKNDTRRLNYQQTVYLRIEKDNCTISLDCTGNALYKRNFRIYTETAPIRETLAASMLLEADLKLYETVIDPFCGSGVIPVEAALMLKRIPPGVKRNFAFERFPGHGEKAFLFLRNELAKNIKHLTGNVSIYANDIDKKAIETVKKNLENSNMTDDIKLSCNDFFKLERKEFSGKKILIATNPPYDHRLKSGSKEDFYGKLGQKLRRDFKGCSFSIIVPGIDTEKAFAMNYKKKLLFINGGIPVSLLIGDIT